MKSKKEALCDYLREYHSGSEKAVPSYKLEAAFNLKGSELRRCINLLRSGGVPICSDENGYYFALTKKELDATVSQLNSRISKMSKARDGIALGRRQLLT